MMACVQEEIIAALKQELDSADRAKADSQDQAAALQAELNRANLELTKEGKKVPELLMVSVGLTFLSQFQSLTWPWSVSQCPAVAPPPLVFGLLRIMILVLSHLPFLRVWLMIVPYLILN